jgi:hypothetical protein
MSRADDDPVGKVSIDDLTVGRTIWFVDTVKSEIQDAAESDIMIPFIYSGEIVEVEEMAMSRVGGKVNREMAIKFQGSDDWGMTFYVGEREYLNQRIFLTKGEAIDESLVWFDGTAHEINEQMERAKAALDFINEQVTQPIIETNYHVARNSGNYIQTLTKRIEADARGESIEGVY